VRCAIGRAVGRRNRGCRAGGEDDCSLVAQAHAEPSILLMEVCRKRAIDTGFLPLHSHALERVEIVVEDRGDDGHHAGFHNPGTDGFRPAHAYVHHALKSQRPLPDGENIGIVGLCWGASWRKLLRSKGRLRGGRRRGFEDSGQALYPAVDGDDLADAG